MEFLSERVSIDRNAERFSVVISPRLSPGKRTLLLLWTIAWTVCGIYIFIERGKLPSGDPLRQYLLAFLAFWAYFEVRVVHALLWRLKGFELWRVKNGQFTIKDSLFGFGKANNYFVDNITGLGLIEIDRESWKWQMNESVWVIGGERLQLEHLGKKIVFGKALSDEEAKALLPVLEHALKHERKKEA